MSKGDAHEDVKTFFSVVAPLCHRPELSKKEYRFPPEIEVRQQYQEWWGGLPSERLKQWIESEKGTKFTGGNPPAGLYSASGCYNHETNVIWLSDENNNERNFCVIAHEVAHALTYDIILRNVPRGRWARSVHHGAVYNLGEVIAETSSFLISRKFFRHVNPHSAFYVADYASRERKPSVVLAKAAPHAVRVIQLMDGVLQ